MKNALLLAVSLLSPLALGQQVYRCGNVYQQAPCSGGRAVDTSDARSDEDRRAAAAVAKGNAKLANEMERDRKAREAGVRPAAATGIPARSDGGQRAGSATDAKKKRSSTRLREKTEFQAIEPGVSAGKKRPTRPQKTATPSQP